MTSSERKECRYQRRMAKRKSHQHFYEFDEVFTFSNLWKAYKRCCRNVGWKSSVINYKSHAFTEVAKTYFSLHNDCFKVQKSTKFKAIRKGKVREVTATHIRERVPEKCFCENCLIPMLRRTLIYDNGATLRGKGTDFAVKRLKRHILAYSRQYPNQEGYALIMDFHHYFPEISHDVLFAMIDRQPMDARLTAFYHTVIDAMEGLNLGSQLSQISAVWFASKYDHYCEMHSLHYGRYMDDSYLINRTREESAEAMRGMREVLRELKILVNPSKLKIVKLSAGVPFLKRRFIGKLVIPTMDSDRYIYHKMKKMIRNNTLVDAGMTYNGWRAYFAKANAYPRLLRMDAYVKKEGFLKHEKKIQNNH